MTAAVGGPAWTPARAEDHLLALELFGMRFGLERMGRLIAALGAPQARIPAAIHVVGTNGKSSTVRMAAALLEAHGVRTGSFTSPHLVSFAERVRVGDAPLDPDAFARAVGRAAAAAREVERGLAEGERVTQFELVTAAALDELARCEVEVAVIEAGLGGRLDATNVLGARVVVLTNVALEHTRWLGDTVAAIAREKLAVLAPGATLVTGALHPEAEREAAAAAARAGAKRVRVGEASGSGALQGYQRGNFALARAAAEALHGPLDPAAVAAVAARVDVPGRLQRVGERPLTLLDGAHNPSGMQALVAALPDVVAGRRLVAVLSVLDDKDAAAMLAALAPRCAAAVVTGASNPRTLAPGALAALARPLGPPVEVEPEPRRALARARVLAGPEGAVLATGSLSLVGDLLSPDGRRRPSAL